MAVIRKRGIGVYNEYLKTDHWQEMRRIVLDRAAGRCESCGVCTRRLDVHHKTYTRVGRESPEDLIVLCRRCHERRHHYYNEEDLLDAGF